MALPFKTWSKKITVMYFLWLLRLSVENVFWGSPACMAWTQASVLLFSRCRWALLPQGTLTEGAAKSLLPLPNAPMPPPSSLPPSIRRPLIEWRQVDLLVGLLEPKLFLLILLTHIKTFSSPLFLKPQEMSLNILILYNLLLTTGGGGDAPPAFTTLAIKPRQLSPSSLYCVSQA